MDKKHCLGCEDDFYNGKNPYGIAECWSLKNAVVVTRYRLSVDTPMCERRGYVAVQVPRCYWKKRYVHLDRIPEYAR